MPAFEGIDMPHAATTYGFPPGHVFAINDPKEVLYEHLGSNRFFIEARPVASPALKQTFTQAEFGMLVRAGKVDPRMDRESDTRRRVAARNPDVQSMRDLPDPERQTLIFFTRLCRRIQDLYEDGLTSKTDDALNRTIPKVMSELVFGIYDEKYEFPERGKGTKGRGRKKSPKTEPKVRRIAARQVFQSFVPPKPTTVRDWIRILIEHDWDEMSLRDHRKGRCGNRAPKIADPLSLAVMSGWVRAYLDRNRPTMAILYKLMIGSSDLEEVNAYRDAQGKGPLAVRYVETFADVNERREREGLPPLAIPSKSTFERAVGRLDKFEVCAARHGLQEARRQFKIAGRREAALAPGERVGIDSWRFQLMTKKLPGHVWAGLPDEIVGKIAALRLNVCVAVCEATKVPLGVRLSVNADSDTVLRTLEMVCSDKSGIAAAAGCRSPWDQACTPEGVPTDSGPENIKDDVRWAIRDIGSMNLIGPARHPDARPWIERFFATLDVQFSAFFQGRTFSGVADKGDYDAGEVANVVSDVLGKALVRYVVDVYMNMPHAGLGGQTPADAWEERTARYGVIPPPNPTVRRAVFGLADTRRIQNRGVRFLGLRYRSKELAKLRVKVGQSDVRIRVDLRDLGAISVCENQPGSVWFTVPCETPMNGVGAEEWIRTAAELRRRHAASAKLREPIVLAAIRDLRIAGLASAEESGIGPSTMSRDEILRLEAKHFAHFDIVVSDRRGRTFEELDSDGGTGAPDAEAAPISPEDAAPEVRDDDVDDEPEPDVPAVRRRGRLGADFLKGE